MIDPFGYWPAKRSRVRKLGGRDKSDDPNYVFHSNYVAVPPGPSVAEVSFENLSAETGMISVRIFQHRASDIPAVTEHGKTTALFPSLAKSNRPVRVPFDALPDATYAVTGYVFGECEARATAIDITIGARSTEVDDPARVRSEFGRRKARHVADIATSEEPSLAWPVSQGFTARQLREPDFDHIAGDLPETLSPQARWETAYIVRVLEQYGRAETGARGLALSMTSDPAAPIVMRTGCDIRSIVLAPGQSIADGCAAQIPNADEARGFDFIWSRPDVFGTGGSARAIGMIEELLERLRPGGLGIHLLPTSAEMDQHGLNRISLGLAALGHIVAQLRHVRGSEGPVPFGIVVRKTTDEIIA